MATATRYGYFRDALYYLACAEHLDFGYVDLPPLFPCIAWIARHTLGTSLPALIFWPALAGAGRIILIAVFAREMGAKRFGTALAAVLGATPAVWWVIDHQFAMNAFEPLLWTGCAYAMLHMIRTGNPKLWLAFGVVAGVGLIGICQIVMSKGRKSSRVRFYSEPIDNQIWKKDDECYGAARQKPRSEKKPTPSRDER